MGSKNANVLHVFCTCWGNNGRGLHWTSPALGAKMMPPLSLEMFFLTKKGKALGSLVRSRGVLFRAGRRWKRCKKKTNQIGLLEDKRASLESVGSLVFSIPEVQKTRLQHVPSLRFPIFEGVVGECAKH